MILLLNSFDALCEFFILFVNLIPVPLSTILCVILFLFLLRLLYLQLSIEYPFIL